MAVTIFRDNNSGKVIFSGVETKAADVNTLSCTIVDTDYLHIADTTSPSNAPLFRKLHYSDVNKKAFSNNLAAGAGNNATEVKAYIDSQITYNVTERNRIKSVCNDLGTVLTISEMMTNLHLQPLVEALLVTVGLTKDRKTIRN